MPRAAATQSNPMTMSVAAISREIKALKQRHKVLLKFEAQIAQQHMEDTDRCIALQAALAVLTWPTRNLRR